MQYIPNSTSVLWRADSSKKQFSPRQPLRACVESMPGLRKLRFTVVTKNHRTSAPSESPVCIEFCHFATPSTPWFGLGTLKREGGDWSSWVPTQVLGWQLRAGGSQKLSCPMEGRSLEGLKLHWSLLLAGLRRCMSPIKLTAEHLKHPQHWKSQKTKLTFSQVQLERG